MPELLTMQDLANGHLDVKALGEAANGDENTIVTTRKGETYPSVKKAIKTLFETGGLPATPFESKALMEASSLTDGDYALITDDANDSGLYVKRLGAWRLSDYNIMPVVDSVIRDERSNLFELQDRNGTTVTYIDNNGDMYLPRMDRSIQDSIAGIDKYDDSSDLYTFEDVSGVPVAAIKKDGSLVVADVITRSGSVEEGLQSSNATQPLKYVDYLMADRDAEPLQISSDLFTHTELDAVYAFAPSLCRISKKEYIAVCEARNGGDFGVSWLVKRKLTINADYSTTLGEVSIIADKGTELGQPYSCINACMVKVETGAHAGRIYIYYLKVFYDNQRDVTFYKYSDDNGETWSAEVNMTEFFPNIAEWVLVVIGAGGKAIQLKEGRHAGRIILPCWHGDSQYYTGNQAGLRSFILYSDDGGVTYKVGASSSFAGSNECQVAELEGGNVMLLMRDASNQKKVEISTDGGETLINPRTLDSVVTTKVESGFCQIKNSYDLSVPKLIISTPTSGRRDLGLYVSYDNGKSFELMKVLMSGVASYSDILPIDESHVLVAYSEGTSIDIDKKVVNIIVNLKSLIGN